MGRGDRQREEGLTRGRASGAMAQLVAHLLCKQGVRGSSPLGSTTDQSPFSGPEEGLCHAAGSSNLQQFSAFWAKRRDLIHISATRVQ